ncbi:MAG TPA: hypothetical protein VHZ78_15535 [Rhizomicrobium sp.]|jgi:hypothetical protein|nr:hypothetical protein [Rhizomicrobium sp.]
MQIFTGMPDPWTFEFSDTLPEIWPPSPPIAIGGSPPDLFVLARNGDTTRRFDLCYMSEDYRCEPKAIVWRGWFVFGLGGRAILWRDSATHAIDLGCYFGEFHPGDDWLLVTSGQGIVRLAPDGRIVWRNDELGLDGVLIFDVEGDVIDGQGEWDPPGGWEDFLVSLETGEALEELPDDEDQDA